MPQEIEIKLRLADPAVLRARLVALNATHVATHREHNTLFDTTTGSLRAADTGLRLRTTYPIDASASTEACVSTLTFKGPRIPASSAAPIAARSAADIKSREEIETTVADPTAAAAILARLGYQPACTYEKLRTVWQLHEAEICLDQLPDLGWFCEIEAPSADHINTVRDQLDLLNAPVEPRTYAALTTRA